MERAARELRAVKVVAVLLQSLKPIFLSVCFQSSLRVPSNLRVSRCSRPLAGVLNWKEQDLGHRGLGWPRADQRSGSRTD